MQYNLVDMHKHVWKLAASIWWIEKCPEDVGVQFVQNVDTYLTGLHGITSQETILVR
jgi:hypothetical protein